MGDKDLFRTWNSHNFSELKKHLMIVGDTMGCCENCKELGLDYIRTFECPGCKTQFQYIAFQKATGSVDGRFAIIKRFLAKRSDLIVVDYDDYKTVAGRDAAHKIFKD